MYNVNQKLTIQRLSRVLYYNAFEKIWIGSLALVIFRSVIRTRGAGCVGDGCTLLYEAAHCGKPMEKLLSMWTWLSYYILNI